MMLRIRTSDGYEIILIREKKWIRLQMLSFMPDTAQQGETISRSPHGERGLKLKGHGDKSVMLRRSPDGKRELKSWRS